MRTSVFSSISSALAMNWYRGARRRSWLMVSASSRTSCKSYDGREVSGFKITAKSVEKLVAQRAPRKLRRKLGDRRAQQENAAASAEIRRKQCFSSRSRKSTIVKQERALFAALLG